MTYPIRPILRKHSKSCEVIPVSIHITNIFQVHTFTGHDFLFLIAAVHHLGEPIKQKGFRLSDQNNILTSDRAKFRINVSGPKDKGKHSIIK